MGRNEAIVLYFSGEKKKHTKKALCSGVNDLDLTFTELASLRLSGELIQRNH